MSCNERDLKTLHRGCKVVKGPSNLAGKTLKIHGFAVTDLLTPIQHSSVPASSVVPIEASSREDLHAFNIAISVTLLTWR